MCAITVVALLMSSGVGAKPLVIEPDSLAGLVTNPHERGIAQMAPGGVENSAFLKPGIEAHLAGQFVLEEFYEEFNEKPKW